MKRSIRAFHEDGEGDPVAELACGHAQHVRHDPPFAERPWAATPEGRQSRIGSELDCARCDRSEIPSGHAPYRETPHFDETSVPRALLERHSTKPGAWAKIRLVRGSLDYHVHAPFDRLEALTPDTAGIVLPEVEHHVSLSGPVEFYVEFWRATKTGT